MPPRERQPVVRIRIPETKATKALVAALCAYEVAAIVSNRVPTITALNHRQPIVGAVLVGALALHFWTPPETTVTVTIA